MIKDITLFSMLKEKGRWLNQRFRVLSQNVANADSPRYKARDLQPLQFKKTLRNEAHKLSLARTHVTHKQSPYDKEIYDVVREKSPYEMSINGNSVVLEEQVTKLNEVNHDHELTVNLTRKYLQLYNSALGLGRR